MRHCKYHDFCEIRHPGLEVAFLSGIFARLEAIWKHWTEQMAFYQSLSFAWSWT